ncbi:DUF3396 domain-containing protein [Corallococcus sp. BB11-1]|uniref:type VI immunity family protein n=1 Tax=Corallococcus sp. BB11-1 TaxID=2996783 RepID=UPI00226F8051|nr:type VI immunity family protein [Corallococcus sp. BB11-1]MCY1030717.1 DUF3396 domain-containing protein [Corallococcus sp. BB11-1]
MQVTRKGRAYTQESISICFYFSSSTVEVSGAVTLALQKFLETTGEQTFTYYGHEDGDWRDLNDAGWELIRAKFLRSIRTHVALTDDRPHPDKYEFNYDGKDLQNQTFRHHPGAVSAVQFILPTAWLKAHGPQRVRNLALALASLLPFNSGHVGLSATGFLDGATIMNDLVPQLLQHPGVDVMDLLLTAYDIGTRLRVPHWMTFIGDPALSEMGGPDFLRSQLHTPGTTVESLDASRAVVTLGPAPEPGGPDQPLPAYRELARVLEPWAFHAPHGPPGFPAATFQQWDRRFLDD